MFPIKQMYFVITEPFPWALESMNLAKPSKNGTQHILRRKIEGKAPTFPISTSITHPALYSFMTHSGQKLSSNLQTAYP